ncbi:MAG: hypothetical protein KBF41_05220, partial [Azonexus sp.]|nr:hypothetical protein [Azonexus sp.]MBP9227502.1 hypothetical protein [Azonexus sp.]
STPCMFVAYRSARAIANMIASSVIRQASIVIPVWFRLVRLREPLICSSPWRRLGSSQLMFQDSGLRRNDETQKNRRTLVWRREHRRVGAAAATGVTRMAPSTFR